MLDNDMERKVNSKFFFFEGCNVYVANNEIFFELVQLREYLM